MKPTAARFQEPAGPEKRVIYGKTRWGLSIVLEGEPGGIILTPDEIDTLNRFAIKSGINKLDVRKLSFFKRLKALFF